MSSADVPWAKGGEGGADQADVRQEPGRNVGVRAEIESLFDSDDNEALPQMVLFKNSNAHVEEMLITMFGPESQAEALGLLKKLRMTTDAPFSSLALATNYRRDWKMMLKWCKNHDLKGKTLVKNFLFGVHPKQLKTELECLECESIDEIMQAFVIAYKSKVRSAKDLTGMGMLTDEKTSASRNGKSGKSEKAAEKKDTLVTTTAQRTPAANRNAVVEKKIVCWNYDAEGHKKPDCPLLKDKKGSSIRLGAVLTVCAKKKGPYLVVEVISPEHIDAQGKAVRVQGFFDSGSDVDAVGQNMVKHLELFGGQTYLLDKPVEVNWLDKNVVREVTHAIDMKLDIVGTNEMVKLKFLVVPWDMDHVVIGWETV